MNEIQNPMNAEMVEKLAKKVVELEERLAKAVIAKKVMCFIRKKTKKNPEYKLMGYHLVKEFGLDHLAAIEVLYNLHKKGKLNRRRWFYSLPEWE